MQPFKIRASACGHIMTEPQKGKTGLSQTAKTYCKDWLKGALYGRKRDIQTKFTSKGHGVEEDGITVLTLEMKLGYFEKNEKHFENDFAKGTPDIIKDGIVYDNKSSWDLHTFPMFETSIPNKDYEWQLQVYMWLTGATKGILSYTLIDTPEHLILDELRRECWRMNEMDIPDSRKYEIAKGLTFTKKGIELLRSAHFPTADIGDFIEIPRNKRIKTFEVPFSEEKIVQIQNRVIECREFVNEFID